MVGVNVVLLTILSLMIGFMIGNVVGKESMKRTFQGLIDQLMKGVRATIGQGTDNKKEVR